MFVVVFFLFSHQSNSQRAVRTLGPIASRGWSVQECLREPTATCDFPGWLTPVHHPIESAHALKHSGGYLTC